MDETATSEIPARGKRSNGPGYVYFIQAQTSLRVKIGRAIDPLARLAQLRAHSPEALGICAAIPHEQPSWREADIHRLFAASRLHGEWFTGTDELMEWVAMNALQGDDLRYELGLVEPPADWRRPLLPRAVERQQAAHMKRLRARYPGLARTWDG